MQPKEAAEERRAAFLERLKNIKILDPACGSGNFLYLALQGVKDIEHQVNIESEMLGLKPQLPFIGPEILKGIESNAVAAELARTTIWIGDLQWQIRNGLHPERRPLLEKLNAVECRDALVTLKADGSYEEAKWPDAEFIVGNPPFLGGKLMLGALGEGYVRAMRKPFEGRLTDFADLVCYWFEKASAQLDAGNTRRVGLVATNSIRGGANRRVLDDVSAKRRFIEAWSDEPWIVDGAAVRVSLVCFGQREEGESQKLDGKLVDEIYSDLTTGQANLTAAKRLTSNAGVSFVGLQKSGPFDVCGELARSWLLLPVNPNGRPNSDVLHPYRNGLDVTRRARGKWIIDFEEKAESEAALYGEPFAYGQEIIEPFRAKSSIATMQGGWWILWRRRPEMRAALKSLTRYMATPEVSKHRVFVWLDCRIWPDKNLTVIARDDDTTLGVLHSRFHESWSLRLGTSLEDRARYTPTTTFETFPFPEGLTPNIPAKDYASDARAIAIAMAAKRLDELRNNWLNPPDMVDILPEVVPGYPDRILPKNVVAAVELKKRTLTNLYNMRPQWLADADGDLDAAVAAAYGWPADISEEDALAKLLELNLSRARATTGLALEVEESDAD